MITEYQKEQYTISTDQALLDFDTLHTFLKQTYWSPGIPKKTLKRAIENSLCFGLYEHRFNFVISTQRTGLLSKNWV